MVSAQPVTARIVNSTRAESDTLLKLLQSLRPAPEGVPQPLWDRALLAPIREFLTRPGKQFRSRLVELAWGIAGRTDPLPQYLPLVVELLHAGSLIVDDIEDDSFQRRGRAALHRQFGVPIALNSGNWLYFWSMSLLAEMGLDESVQSEIYRVSMEKIRRCHEGQALDLTARIGDLHPDDLRGVCHTVSAWKTGSLMALAAAHGAIAGGTSHRTVTALMTFGERLGVGLQMQNDLSELTGGAGPIKHPEDLIHGRVTWPWVWAAERVPASKFDALQVRGAKLAKGSGDAALLARDLLASLGPDPAQPVCKWLSQAVNELCEELPTSSSLSTIKSEVYRLINHYS